jgi:hypothetical protein
MYYFHRYLKNDSGRPPIQSDVTLLVVSIGLSFVVMHYVQVLICVVVFCSVKSFVSGCLSCTTALSTTVGCWDCSTLLLECKHKKRKKKVVAFDNSCGVVVTTLISIWRHVSTGSTGRFECTYDKGTRIFVLLSLFTPRKQQFSSVVFTQMLFCGCCTTKRRSRETTTLVKSVALNELNPEIE